MKDKVLKLYSTCIPVKGYGRSILCDLQFCEYKFIPNALSELLINSPNLTIKEIYALFDNEVHQTLNEYIEYLLKEDLAFLTDVPELFPPLKLSWYRPSHITNVIIDIDENSNLEYIKTLVENLNELGCEAARLCVLYDISTEALPEILEVFNESILTYMELNLKFSVSFNVEFCESLLREFSRIQLIVVFNSPKSEKIQYDNILLRYTEKDINTNCGKVSAGYFSCCMENFLEAYCFNSCLHKKMYIGADHTIKNCPHFEKSFGKIEDIDLKNTIHSDEFQMLWSITKDKIDVCKDCEFRYICTDCRAIIKDPQNKFSQPAECTYNPYICKWKGEEGYVPVEECGQYSKETGFIPDTHIIETLNNRLWGTE
jgi:SPASM domain peptide maturase of grasp-with-spasm system